MLVISHTQMGAFERGAEDGFLERLRGHLARRHPAFLPRFPPPVQTLILARMTERARSRGATWESSIALYCDLMEGVAPNFDAVPEIASAIGPPDRGADERIAALAERVPAQAWARAEAGRDELALYAPVGLDDASPAERLAAALPLVLWDSVTADGAVAAAERALALAARHGFAEHAGGLADAGLALAGWQALYGSTPAARSASWLRDVSDPGRPAAERLALLRLRIMLDHGRRV